MTSSKSSTGCWILDAKGITAGNYGGREICLRCKEKECILVRKDRLAKIKAVKRKGSITKEIYVQCKHCGATETLTLRNGQLVKTTRWQQRGEKLIHLIDCGEVK